MSNVYDIFIWGGGINGAGIARDAAEKALNELSKYLPINTKKSWTDKKKLI